MFWSALTGLDSPVFSGLAGRCCELAGFRHTYFEFGG